MVGQVDLVVNMEIPSHGKDYIHRVGRTARAGRAGRSIAFVTQVYSGRSIAFVGTIFAS